MLHVTALSLQDWMIVMTAALIPAVVGQMMKMTRYGASSP
jgi:hypothetical protein